MARVGVLPHATKPEARELAPKVVRWLVDRGHQVALLDRDASDLGFAPLSADAAAFRTLDLLVVLGGDGTMLHGVDLAGFASVPVLGVNLGLLGFLTEVGADAVFDALDAALSGRGRLEDRSTVQAEISGRTLGQGFNEVSLERAIGGKVIRMSVTIGGQPFTSFAADGILVATPTGSTAYAFSMRGPVVAPELRCLVVVAVGAHTLFDRPVVVPPGMDVEVAIRHGGRGVVLMDGHVCGEIGEGDVLRASVGASTVRLVRLSPASTFTRLAQRFGLPPA